MARAWEIFAGFLPRIYCYALSGKYPFQRGNCDIRASILIGSYRQLAGRETLQCAPASS
jgi:hypothetical protein